VCYALHERTLLLSYMNGTSTIHVDDVSFILYILEECPHIDVGLWTSILLYGVGANIFSFYTTCIIKQKLDHSMYVKHFNDTHVIL
jgi:hypothetical protein